MRKIQYSSSCQLQFHLEQHEVKLVLCRSRPSVNNFFSVLSVSLKKSQGALFSHSSITELTEGTNTQSHFQRMKKNTFSLQQQIICSRSPVFFRSSIGLGSLTLTGSFSEKLEYMVEFVPLFIQCQSLEGKEYFRKTYSNYGALQIYEEVLIRCFLQLVCLLRYCLRTYQTMIVKDK